MHRQFLPLPDGWGRTLGADHRDAFRSAGIEAHGKIPGSTRKLDRALADPARAGGAEADILPVFRASRDDIKRRVQALPADVR